VTVNIGRTVEAYVDNIVVKLKHANSLINDLGLAFAALKAKNVKLNPKKVCFRGPEGYAVRIHSFSARHRGQPGENFSNNELGPNLELKGSATSYGMPIHSQQVHLAPWRTRVATLQASEEG
jgi:hypothetical protein